MESAAILQIVDCNGETKMPDYPCAEFYYKHWCNTEKKYKKKFGYGKNHLLGRVQLVYKKDYGVNEPIDDKQVVVNLYAKETAKDDVDFEALKQCLEQVDGLFGDQKITIIRPEAKIYRRMELLAKDTFKNCRFAFVN